MYIMYCLSKKFWPIFYTNYYNTLGKDLLDYTVNDKRFSRKACNTFFNIWLFKKYSYVADCSHLYSLSIFACIMVVWKQRGRDTMALITEGNSETGAHLKSNLCYLICLRHLIKLRLVTNRIFFLLFLCVPAVINTWMIFTLRDLLRIF